MNNNLIKKANGKVLLSAEYAVMDGALAIALPTKYGQVMAVTFSDEHREVLHWSSLDMYHEVWFEAEVSTGTGDILSSTGADTAETLQKILRLLISDNPSFWSKVETIKIKADYPLNWGLGSSSTLIYLCSEICGADPYKLQYEIFGGSAYDIACAQSDTPVKYKKITEEERMVTSISFSPKYKDRWAFVYLGQKQDSRKGISYYRSKGDPPSEFLEVISAISSELADPSTSHARIVALLRQHEDVISSHLDLPKVQDQYFPEFDGVVKSLGAWGGDFVVAVAAENPIAPEYFYDKGYPNVIPYTSMIMK